MDIICGDRGLLRTPQHRSSAGEVKIIRSNLEWMETLVLLNSCRAEPFDLPNFTKSHLEKQQGSCSRWECIFGLHPSENPIYYIAEMVQEEIPIALMHIKENRI